MAQCYSPPTKYHHKPPLSGWNHSKDMGFSLFCKINVTTYHNDNGHSNLVVIKAISACHLLLACWMLLSSAVEVTSAPWLGPAVFADLCNRAKAENDCAPEVLAAFGIDRCVGVAATPKCTLEMYAPPEKGLNNLLRRYLLFWCHYSPATWDLSWGRMPVLFPKRTVRWLMWQRPSGAMGSSQVDCTERFFNFTTITCYEAELWDTLLQAILISKTLKCAQDSACPYYIICLINTEIWAVKWNYLLWPVILSRAKSLTPRVAQKEAPACFPMHIWHSGRSHTPYSAAAGRPSQWRSALPFSYLILNLSK